MSYRQLRDASMSVGYVGGWCLKYVQDAFGTDHPYPTAAAAWEAEPVASSHGELPPLGITVPIYLSLGNVPAGHVAIRLDDGWVASSSLPGNHNTPYYYKSVDALVADYAQYNGGATYLGWGEHVGSVRVVEAVPDVVLATADQIQAAYHELLGRDADPDGISHYEQFTIDFVRQDLLSSTEYKERQAALQPAPNPVVAPIHNPDPTPVIVPVVPDPTPAPEPTPAPIVEPAPEVNSPPVVTPIPVTHIPTPEHTITVSNPQPVASLSILQWIIALIKSIIGVK